MTNNRCSATKTNITIENPLTVTTSTADEALLFQPLSAKEDSVVVSSNDGDDPISSSYSVRVLQTKYNSAQYIAVDEIF